MQNSHKWDYSKDSTNAKYTHLHINKLEEGDCISDFCVGGGPSVLDYGPFLAEQYAPKTSLLAEQQGIASNIDIIHINWFEDMAQTYRQWGADNVYLLVLSSWEVNIA